MAMASIVYGQPTGELVAQADGLGGTWRCDAFIA